MIDSSSTSTFHLPTEESTDTNGDTPGVLNGYVKNLENQEPVRQELSGRDIERAALPEAEQHGLDLFVEESLNPDLYNDVKVESVTTAHETVAQPQPSLEEQKDALRPTIEAMSTQGKTEQLRGLTNYIPANRAHELAQANDKTEVKVQSVSPFKKVLSLITGSPTTGKKRSFKNLTERQLIEMESEIGGKLFGQIPAGHRRDFFCLDNQTWVWHEEWVDPETGKKRTSTTRYEVHTNGILKAQDGINYRFIEGEELTNLTVAARLYYEQTMLNIYQRDPITGRPLSETPPATIET